MFRQNHRYEAPESDGGATGGGATPAASVPSAAPARPQTPKPTPNANTAGGRKPSAYEKTLLRKMGVKKPGKIDDIDRFAQEYSAKRAAQKAELNGLRAGASKMETARKTLLDQLPAHHRAAIEGQAGGDHAMAIELATKALGRGPEGQRTVQPGLTTSAAPTVSPGTSSAPTTPEAPTYARYRELLQKNPWIASAYAATHPEIFDRK